MKKRKKERKKKKIETTAAKYNRLVACRKFWLTPADQVPCSNAANIAERKVNFAPGKLPSGGKRTRRCVYSVPAQETRPNDPCCTKRPLAIVYLGRVNTAGSEAHVAASVA